MGIQGLDWQTVQIPFSSGLNLKADARAMEPPGLDICRDVQFDDVGGLQTRYPYSALGNNILGGGTLANCRRFYDNAGEALCFTSDSLYSWSHLDTAWALKATHLAVKMDEGIAFGTNGDQIDCDRAELGGAVIFTWVDTENVYAAVIDKSTGATLLAPTLISAGTRARLCTLNTRILLFFHFGTDSAPGSLVGFTINPASAVADILAIAAEIFVLPTVILASPNFGSFYDVCQNLTKDEAIVVARRVTTTSYSLIKVTSAMAVTATTVARTCNQSIAVATDPTGTYAQVIRSVDGGTGAIKADYIQISGAVDQHINTAIGTYASGGIVNQIAIASRSVKNGGVYRFYVFWSSDEASDGTAWSTRSNWVNESASVGTAAVFVYRLGIASRAFDYNGQIYVWLAFAGASTFTGGNLAGFSAQLQNTYFLYRDDAFLCAKAARARAGGFADSQGRLPDVRLTDGSTTYRWCGSTRRIIPIGTNQTGYSKRAPIDISLTFDSNEARRCVRLGKTLYIACGEGVLQYDGSGLYETGTHIYPWWFEPSQATGGSKPDGTYAYKVTERFDNAQGEVDRSTVATVAQIKITGGPAGTTLAIVPLYVTHKTATNETIEVWATALNPTADSPFYLVTNLNPAQTSNPNRYVPNDPTLSIAASFDDKEADSTVTTNQNNPENGAVLPSEVPPACTVIAASSTRLFIAGIAGDPDTVWYSRLRGEGEVAGFSEELTIKIPPDGGAITAIALMDGVLVVFRENAIYYANGDGFDNTGGGQNYGPVQRVPGKSGAVNAESVGLTDKGLFFKTSLGFAILNRSFTVDEVGVPVEDFKTDQLYAVDVMPNQRQVRCLSEARMLVYDTLVQQWSEWTISDGVHATVWNGGHVYLTATGPKVQGSTYTGLTYGLDVETAWIKLNGLQGYGAVRWIYPLGEWRSAHHLRARIARDYEWSASNSAWSYFDDDDCIPTSDQQVVGGPLQFAISPKISDMQAIKVRLTAYANPSGDYSTPPAGEALKLTGLALDVGIKRGLFNALPAGQKV